MAVLINGALLKKRGKSNILCVLSDNLNGQKKFLSHLMAKVWVLELDEILVKTDTVCE